MRDTIANVITGYSGRSWYDPYYGTPYNSNYYTTNYRSYSTNYSPYYPNYYESGYYNSYGMTDYDYPDYSNYYYDDYPSYLTTSYYPVYSGYYDPYSFVYDSPAYQQYYDPYGVNYDDPYSAYDEGYGTDYCSLASNGYWYPGSLADTLGKLVATGYDQGYSDGLDANYYNADNGFYNPYSYEDTSYDSYSYRLAENRQCLSQGYELGYQDALAGRGEYNPLYSGNNDLVSMLLGSVLQTVNN